MVYNQKQKNLPEYENVRRELRTKGTPAEATLWKALKGKQIYRTSWRRQYSIGAYILDFYCPSLRLCIELDGNPHYTIEGSSHDSKRDQWLLEKYNIKTLRYENKEVFYCHDSVIENIKQVVQEHLKITKQTPSPKKGTPSNLEGE